jgi:hypothetical protein
MMTDGKKNVRNPSLVQVRSIKLSQTKVVQRGGKKGMDGL